MKYLFSLVSLTLLLGACQPAVQLSTNQQRTLAETYIRSNIETLSPEEPVLGGTWFVTDIEWRDEDTAIVSYEDGHIMHVARAEVSWSASAIMIDEFVIESDSGESIEFGAQEGEFCGGIAAIQCAQHLQCQMDGDYPDAGGTCVRP